MRSNRRGSVYTTSILSIRHTRGTTMRRHRQERVMVLGAVTCLLAWLESLLRRSILMMVHGWWGDSCILLSLTTHWHYRGSTRVVWTWSITFKDICILGGNVWRCWGIDLVFGSLKTEFATLEIRAIWQIGGGWEHALVLVLFVSRRVDVFNVFIA